MKDHFRSKNCLSKKNFNEDKISNIQLLEEEEIDQLKMEVSSLQDTSYSCLDCSVLKVVFKSEASARKYKTKVENFLKDLLEEGEDFIVFHSSQNQLSEENHQKQFHIDNIHKSDDEDCACVPVYSSAYEDVLHSDKVELVETDKEEKVPQMTCFNCLGNHHMKECPEKIDRSRINANKKDILVGNNIRYHTDEQNLSLKPGILSSQLRSALGLNENQLPRFIYHMRVIGYPPGWMEEATIEKSGLSLYDVEGRAVGEENSSLPSSGVLYDGSKFIGYPGFNSPVPKGYIDEWNALNMPPLQSHQQLEAALNSSNTIISSAIYKRKQYVSDETDSKKHKNMQERSVSPNLSVPGKCTLNYSNNTPEHLSKRHSLSLCKSPGTPILEQGNPYNRLPDANKFAQGITEHLPFENLPDSVGKFEKMRGVISDVQRKLNNLQKS